MRASSGENPQVRHERTDVGGGPFLAAFTLASGVSIVALLLWGLLSVFSGFEVKPEVSPYFKQQWNAVGPGLETSRTYDLPDIRKRENENLYSYHWIDRAHGIVQIPIDRAIDFAVERGFPDWAGKPEPETAKGTQEGGH